VVNLDDRAFATISHSGMTMRASSRIRVVFSGSGREQTRALKSQILHFSGFEGGAGDGASLFGAGAVLGVATSASGSVAGWSRVEVEMFS
jgi:hypothetical protein